MNLICGINPVLEALGAGTRHFDRLLVAKGLRNRRISEAIHKATHLAVPLRFETRETLDRMAGEVPHQGIIAVVSAKPTMSLESLLEGVKEPALLMVLDGVEDPRNLGAILRTAEAAGVDGVLLPERHSAGLSETVGRASAGALEHVKVARVGNLVQALEALKARGVWVVGFDAAGRERWDGVDMKRPVALVVGGEGRGMRRLVREHCDHLVSIPLFGHITSLNVSVAAGVALYEAVRQRGKVPSFVRPIPARPATSPQVVGPRADDGEADPGALRPQVASTTGDSDDHEPGENHFSIELHEEAAWAGPTILKAIEHRPGPRHLRRRDRDRDRGRGHERHEGGGPRDVPRDGQAPDEPRQERRDGNREERRGRRRRRRGRRGPGEAPGPGGPGARSHGGPGAQDPGEAGPYVPPAGDGPSPGPEIQANGAGPGGQGTPGDGRRRRRRRRRRH
jgi:23S rRNA (guanosine2251-2'-O)-methyltransferase